VFGIYVLRQVSIFWGVVFMVVDLRRRNGFLFWIFLGVISFLAFILAGLPVRHNLTRCWGVSRLVLSLAPS